MDHIKFHHETVLSDVHVLTPNARHLMTRLNSVGQPIFVSIFRILSDRDSTEPGTRLKGQGDTDEEDEDDPGLDEDGDFNVTHCPRTNTDRDVHCPIVLQQSNPGPEHLDDDDYTLSEDAIRIEHTMATPLDDVGKQVWRGAFLLADFILSEPAMFKGATVLELGAGTGLTSIIMATTVKKVYCTDVGEDLLSMCSRNVMFNRHIGVGEVRVRHLDWLQKDLRTDVELDFGWTQEEVTDMYNNTDVIVAADVCYDDELTDGLFRTLERLCSSFAHRCSVFISIERRINFSLRHLSVSCKAYDHFRRHLTRLQGLQDGPCGFTVEQLPAHFPQALLYDRVDQLELWRISATPRALLAPAQASCPGFSVIK